MEEVVQIGSVLDGRYRIDAVLGTGGMGRVYRGEHTGIGRAVAIKVLHADLGRNREAAQRFQREAIASGRLDHANIVGVSDFGVIEDGPCYLVMEALEGESLGDRLARDKRIPWQEAIDLIRGVLSGLRHAHDRGVVHRDIKPDNIFLAIKDGELVVKILDFGIAKLAAGSPDDPASTRAGLTVGTPAYLSPEQAVGGEIGPPCDLYSTTIVLFEMLTGRPPFHETDPLAMLGAHVGRPPPTLAEAAPDLEVPPLLEDVIARGLAKLGSERTATALDYLILLDQVSPSANPIPPMPPRMTNPALATPPVGLAIAPTASALPHATTPVPHAVTPMPTSHATPMPSRATPLAMSVVSPIADTSLFEARPRATSIADAPEPIPRKWIAIGGAVVVGFLILAVILLAARDHSATTTVPLPIPIPVPDTLDKPAPKPDKPTPKPTKPAAKVDEPKPAPPPPPVEPPPPADKTVEPPDPAFKVAVSELIHGKTCPDRKKAIAKLVALGDPRAIVNLTAARSRPYGGVLGMGQKNANACLVADANAAIKKLTPPAPGK